VLRDMKQPAQARRHLEESLALNRQVGDRWAVANVLTSLGEVAADLEDWGTARSFLTESLGINLELGDRTAVAFILEGFAAIAAAQAEPRRALLLFGAASALRQTLGSPLSPTEQSRLDQYLEPAHRALPAEETAALTRQGAAMTFEEAAAAALAAPLGH
jgi:hypothetical protein